MSRRAIDDWVHGNGHTKDTTIIINSSLDREATRSIKGAQRSTIYVFFAVRSIDRCCPVQTTIYRYVDIVVESILIV